jgi:dTDP-4-amino-4,6-dideoxygalactose transaminase
MDSVLALAEQYKLVVIEDACQAHGAEYFSEKDRRWKKAGSMGQAAAFSFYPGKNLGACGEAGAVTTSDAELARKIRMLRDHGQAKKYYHDVEGYNGRLDAIQAGILEVKLRRLAVWNEQRRQHAKCYRELLGSVEGVILPVEPSWSNSVYHLFVIRVEDRGKLHLQKAYANLGYRLGDFPVAELCASEIVSLPMFPGLRNEEQQQVVQAISACLGCGSDGKLMRAAANAND